MRQCHSSLKDRVLPEVLLQAGENGGSVGDASGIVFIGMLAWFNMVAGGPTVDGVTMELGMVISTVHLISPSSQPGGLDTS